MASPGQRLLLCLLGVVLLGVGHGLYFHIGETERKCFIEEIPDETMVTGACVCVCVGE